MVYPWSKTNWNLHFRGGCHINLVETDAVFAQDSQTRQTFQQNRARVSIVPADDSVEVPHQFEHLALGQWSANLGDFVAFALEQFVVRSWCVSKRRGGKEYACHEE